LAFKCTRNCACITGIVSGEKTTKSEDLALMRPFRDTVLLLSKNYKKGTGFSTTEVKSRACLNE